MRFYGPLVGVAALAAALRWYRIDAQSLWYDEGISAHQLMRSFPEILRAAALDTHPPLYYWTLKVWGEAFGSSELALRSLSAVWGVAMVVLTFLIGRRLFGTVVGAVAAVLVAAAPLAVYYSQEVRMYAQVTALALLAAYAYSRRSYWLYAVAGALTLYSQYLGIAVLGALNVHALIWWRERSKREWLIWLGANAAIALAFLPWLPTFIDQQSHALNTSPRTAVGLTVDTLTAYAGGVAQGDTFLWAGAALVLLAAIGCASSLFWRDKRSAENVTLLALLWLFPLGLVIALGFRSGLFEIRYLVVGLPGLLLLSALGLVRLVHWPALVPVATAAALVPAVLGLRAQYFDPSLARDDYRDLVLDIERGAQPGDAVVLVAPNQTEIFNYYYHGDLPTIGLPAQRPIDASDAVARLEAIRAQYQRVWLVAWAMTEADPHGVIANWLAENGFQATHQWYGSVQLELIGLTPTSASMEKVDAALDNGVVLDGYRIGTRTLRPGDTLDLTLVWRAAGGPTPDHWKVFTHLLDANSLVVAQRDAEPADNLRPTTSWQRGEQIQDNYGIAIPENLPPGSYTLEIGMYDGDRRSHIDGGADHLILGQVQVVNPQGG
ncbi:MAG: glycosyltransferase family 39 protein [Chloroflexi bacterium]|nr:glycosyltransferase family 39 protein [Chloroflexota bacterium]